MTNTKPGEEELRIAQMRSKLVQQLKSYRLIQSATVEAAFQEVPRHLFLPGIDVARVYSDTAIATKTENGIPISSSSQPAVMACMLEQLDVQPGQRILEIGTGTGYNAALLAHMVGKSGSVTTIDIDKDTVMSAQRHLRTAGYQQVHVFHGDGGMGMAALAPYDRIILTVGADDITPAWRQQLVPGGKLVLPFKLAQFHSILNIPFTQDQVSLALQRVDDHLVSYSMYAVGFIPLRGTFAIQQRRSLMLDKGITFASNKSISKNTTLLLQQPFHDQETTIEVNTHELWGLHIWLVLQEPDYCELQKKGADQQYQYLPALGQQGDGATVSYGLFSEHGISLLYNKNVTTPAQKENEDALDEEEPHNAAHWHLTGKLVIRHFGQDDELAQHLYRTIYAWDKAGRPFQWGFPQAIDNLTIHAYPAGRAYSRGPRELISPRKGSLMIFSW